MGDICVDCCDRLVTGLAAGPSIAGKHNCVFSLEFCVNIVVLLLPLMPVIDLMCCGHAMSRRLDVRPATNAHHRDRCAQHHQHLA